MCEELPFPNPGKREVGGVSAADWERWLRAGEDVSSYTKIMGKAVATVEQMREYIKLKNPSVAQSVLDMIPLYLSEGEAEGVRADIAFAQSCLETGNFGFSGSAVTLEQNNFCGMGVTSNGKKGNSFDSPQMGIRAQVQHLKAYACMDKLVNPKVDPRFRYVVRVLRLMWNGWGFRRIRTERAGLPGQVMAVRFWLF